MEVSVPLSGELSLRMSDAARDASAYPTGRLQRGLLLVHEADDLAEEGVGFGVPILKRGVQTVFPGSVRLASRRRGPTTVVTATFAMNLVERVATADGGNLRSRLLYATRDSLAALHRRCPALRGPLTRVSNTLRSTFGWVTTFEDAGTCAVATVVYSIRATERGARIAVDVSGLPAEGLSEVVVMNELGARHFDRYLDSGGARLTGAQIGSWDKVTAAEASFVSPAAGVAFSLRQVAGASLHRGRELVGSRLSWSGFGYSLSPKFAAFRYDVRIERSA